LSTKKNVFDAKQAKQKISFKITDIINEISQHENANIPTFGINVKSPFLFLNYENKFEIKNICRHLGININEDVYITYTNKHNDNKEYNFKHYFGKEIYTIKPRVIFVCDEKSYEWLNSRCILNNGEIIIPIYFSENEEKTYDYECKIINLFDIDLKEIKQEISLIKLDYYFTHLHVHDSYSLKDGVGLPKERVQWALDNDKHCLSTTNHGNISNWMMMYTMCNNNNIKPILGIEAYFNRDAEELRIATKNNDKESKIKRKQLRRHGNHITLLAKNLKGYYNIITCSNDAWVNGFYMYPYMSPKTIEENHEGVICLSGCSGSEINKIYSYKYYLESDKRKFDIENIIKNKTQTMNLLYSNNDIEKISENEYFDTFDFDYYNNNKNFNEYDYINKLTNKIKDEDKFNIENCNTKVEEIVDWWHSIFGNDYYIEIMVIGFDLQVKLNQELIKLAKKKNIKIVLTHDVHYTYEDGWAVQQLQMLNDQNKTFEDLANDTENKIWIIKSKDLYYKDVYELHDSWEQYHKSEIFTEEVFYEACQNTIEISNKIEKFEIDKSSKLPKLYENGFEILSKMAWDGLNKKQLDSKKDYCERLQFELDIINKKGFVDYFLVVQEMIMWTKTTYTREHVGAGRGSSAGSLVNYCIGITDVDPIKHDLMFARFLDIEREDVVDIDTDYAPVVRDKVIEHLISKYGQDYVAPVGSLGTTRTKVAIQDSARVLGIPIQETLQLTSKVLTEIDDDISWEENIELYPELKQYIENNKKYSYNGFDVNFFAKRIKGSIRQFSQHAAGVVVSSESLMKTMPLVSATKYIVTAYQEGGDYRELSDNNYYKIDVLGLNNLQVIIDTMKLIKERHNIYVDWDKIDVNEKEPYIEICQKGDHLGVFQFESFIAGQVLEMIKPANFDELSACSAILRPGPLRMGMHEEFAKNKFSKDIKIPKCLQRILGPTYGVIAYQEQFMEMAYEFGLSMGEVNVFRKALVKLQKSADAEAKRLAKVESYHKLFVEGASKPDKIGNKEEAEKWWELVKNFAAYGFNKAHCVSYTYVSFREYWLKYHYDLEFNVALLNNTPKGKEDNGESVIASYISQIMAKGYTVKGPTITDAYEQFSINSKNEIVWGFNSIKGLSNIISSKIIEERNKKQFSSLNDFYNRVNPDKRSIDALLWSGAFDGIEIEQETDIFGCSYYSCSTREEIEEFIFKKLRNEKRFEKNSFSIKEKIEKEKEYLNISFIEINNFAEIRKEIGNKVKLQFQSNCSSEGKYNVYGVVSLTANKTTKTGKKYQQFSIYDETGSIKNISIWQWKTNVSVKKEDRGIFKIQIDDKGFKSLISFVKYG